MQPQVAHSASPGLPPAPIMVMPLPERNGLGAFGFAIALVGLVVPSGVVSLLGLILSLAAIGRAPRGLATAGVILGLLGTLFWLLVLVGLLILGVGVAAVALVAAAGAFTIAQPEVVELTSDMVNLVVATEAYEDEHGAPPAEFAALGLRLPVTLDPWGQPYAFGPPPDRGDFELTFNIVSSGPDRQFGTSDDIGLDHLEEVWERSFLDFEDRMEEFGRKLEQLEATGWHRPPQYSEGIGQFSADSYLRRAILTLDPAQEAGAPQAEGQAATSENSRSADAAAAPPGG